MANNVLFLSSLTGKCVTKVISVEDNNVFDGCDSKQLITELCGATILSVNRWNAPLKLKQCAICLRKGKNIWFVLRGKGSQETSCFFHQGMTGAFSVRDHEDESIKYQDFNTDSKGIWPPPWAHLFIFLLNIIMIIFIFIILIIILIILLFCCCYYYYYYHYYYFYFHYYYYACIDLLIIVYL